MAGDGVVVAPLLREDRPRLVGHTAPRHVGSVLERGAPIENSAGVGLGDAAGLGLCPREGDRQDGDGQEARQCPRHFKALQTAPEGGAREGDDG